MKINSMRRCLSANQASLGKRRSLFETMAVRRKHSLELLPSPKTSATALYRCKHCRLSCRVSKASANTLLESLHCSGHPLTWDEVQADPESLRQHFLWEGLRGQRFEEAIIFSLGGIPLFTLFEGDVYEVPVGSLNPERTRALRRYVPVPIAEGFNGPEVTGYGAKDTLRVSVLGGILS